MPVDFSLIPETTSVAPEDLVLLYNGTELEVNIQVQDLMAGVRSFDSVTTLLSTDETIFVNSLGVAYRVNMIELSALYYAVAGRTIRNVFIGTPALPGALAINNDQWGADPYSMGGIVLNNNNGGWVNQARRSGSRQEEIRPATSASHIAYHHQQAFSGESAGVDQAKVRAPAVIGQGIDFVAIAAATDGTDAFWYKLIGIYNNETPQKALWFYIPTTLDANATWTVYTNDGAVQTTHVTTSVKAYEKGVWHKFRIKGINGDTEFEFYIDDVLVATVSTTLPSVGTPMGGAIYGGYWSSDAAHDVAWMMLRTEAKVYA